MKTYFQKLKDPRWQKLRLEVLSSNNFECSNCGDKENTLHVHHPAYVKGREPWDYHFDELMCLCENCHKEEHITMDMLKAEIDKLRLDINLRENSMVIVGFLSAFNHDGPFSLHIPDYNFAYGVAIYFQKAPLEIIDLMINGELSSETISQLKKSGSVILDTERKEKQAYNKKRVANG